MGAGKSTPVKHVMHSMQISTLHSLVGGVASIEPDPVEAQGKKLSDDGPQSTPSSQQQLNKHPRVDCLSHHI